MIVVKNLFKTVVLGLFIAGAAIVMPPQSHTQSSNAAGDDGTITFDHSNCQYPDRTTNPPDGCDNSDPCDPAMVKGGSGDCVDIPATNVNETPVTVDVPQCGVTK